MINDKRRLKHKSISASKLHKKRNKKSKAKKETRIKKFNDLAVQSKSKRKLHKRRKVKNTRGDQENNKNMINIKTQNRDTSYMGINNISFAYESIDISRPKPVHDESTDVKCSTSKFPLHEQDQSGGNITTDSQLLSKRMKVRKISLCVGNKIPKKKIKKSQVISGSGTITKKKRKKSPKPKKVKQVDKEDPNLCNMPLQVESKLKHSFQIDDIVKDTIKKKYQDKLLKKKEEEQIRESQELQRKKLDEMNEGIRKKNLMQNERAKTKSRDENGNPLLSNGMAFNLIPWGADQTQFQQQTIENDSCKLKDRRATTPSPFKCTPRGKSEESASRSDRGALGMEFLDFKPKTKRKSSKRKSSYQNTTKEKRIEIEEKDSIEVEHHKVSYAQTKKTTIYNKTERDHNVGYEAKKEKDKQSVFDLFKNHKRKNMSSIKHQLDINPRSRSAKSASKNRHTSNHSHREINDFIKHQNK